MSGFNKFISNPDNGSIPEDQKLEEEIEIKEIYDDEDYYNNNNNNNELPKTPQQPIEIVSGKNPFYGMHPNQYINPSTPLNIYQSQTPLQSRQFQPPKTPQPLQFPSVKQNLVSEQSPKIIQKKKTQLQQQQQQEQTMRLIPVRIRNDIEKKPKTIRSKSKLFQSNNTDTDTDKKKIQTTLDGVVKYVTEEEKQKIHDSKMRDLQREKEYKKAKRELEELDIEEEKQYIMQYLNEDLSDPEKVLSVFKGKITLSQELINISKKIYSFIRNKRHSAEMYKVLKYAYLYSKLQNEEIRKQQPHLLPINYVNNTTINENQFEMPIGNNSINELPIIEEQTYNQQLQQQQYLQYIQEQQQLQQQYNQQQQLQQLQQLQYQEQLQQQQQQQYYYYPQQQYIQEQTVQEEQMQQMQQMQQEEQVQQNIISEIRKLEFKSIPVNNTYIVIKDNKEYIINKIKEMYLNDLERQYEEALENKYPENIINQINQIFDLIFTIMVEENEIIIPFPDSLPFSIKKEGRLTGKQSKTRI